MTTQVKIAVKQTEPFEIGCKLNNSTKVGNLRILKLIFV
jgi:hypothetical protein